MDVVVTATVAATAMAVVHGGCDGGDFGKVERRRGGGVRMMMMAAVERRWDGEVDSDMMLVGDEVRVLVVGCGGRIFGQMLTPEKMGRERGDGRA
ncbi:hypothetical protein Tco_1046606 [Tanacetum coccineum]